MSKDGGEWVETRTELPRDGELVELAFRDALGTYTDAGPFFMNDDGKWFRTNPPARLRVSPKAWRPAACSEAEATQREGEARSQSQHPKE